MVQTIKLLIQKSQKNYGDEIPLEVQVPSNRETWAIRRFVVRTLVENIDNLSVLWKRNLNQDGERILRCRLLCIYQHVERGDSCTTYRNIKIPHETKVHELRTDLPIRVSLLSRSHLCTNPRLKPIPRIRKSENK